MKQLELSVLCNSSQLSAPGLFSQEALPAVWHGFQNHSKIGSLIIIPMAYWDLQLWTLRFNKNMDTRSANNSKIDPQVQLSLRSLLKCKFSFLSQSERIRKISVVLTKSKQKFIFDSLLDKILWISRFVSIRPKGLEFSSFRDSDRTTKLIHFYTRGTFVKIIQKQLSRSVQKRPTACDFIE